MVMKKKTTAKKKTPAKETTPAKSTPAAPTGTATEPFADFHRWMDEAFNRGWLHLLRDRWPRFEDLIPGVEAHMPKVDVIDKDGEVRIKAELPGVKKEDLDVSLSDNSVTIRATTRSETEEEREGEYFRREIRSGEFRRTLPLPNEVIGDKASANFEDGVLTLVLPKAAKAKRRRVKVQ